MLKLRSFIDEIQFRHQPDQTPIFYFSTEFTVKIVVKMKCGVKGGHHLSRDAGNELVNGFIMVLLSTVEPHHGVLELRLVEALELVHSLGKILSSVCGMR